MSENLLKKIFAKNLNHYVAGADKSQTEIAAILGISTSTFSSWCTAQKMPRMDSIQALADYFHIQKSELIEEKPAPNNEGGHSTELLHIIERVQRLSPDNQSKLSELIDLFLNSQDNMK